MTVLTSVNKRIAVGNGSTKDFPFTFAFFDNTEIEVQVDGVMQTETTHYTLTNDDPGGTVSFITAPASAAQVLIRRILPLTQTFDYVENDNFPAESHEEALDRVVMIVQQQQEELDRSLKVDPTEEGDFTFPSLDSQAGKTLVVNPAEDGFDLATVSGGGSLTSPLPIAEGGTQATTAAGARAALGINIAQDIKLTVFTADGTWTKDADAFLVEVEVIGAGGGGGGAEATGAGEAAAGGGGGAGGYARKLFDETELAATEAVVVGTGGTGGVGTSGGGGGAASAFADGKAYEVAGNGGSGGNGATATNGSSVTPGGAGGGASGGDVNGTGSPGGHAAWVSGFSLGGGHGGDSVLGGGARGSFGSTDGFFPFGPGAGGGGGSNQASQGTNKDGGDGADGIVIVREYLT